MNKLLIIFVLLCLASNIFLPPLLGAENAEDFLKAGDEYYSQYKLDKAMEEYEKASASYLSENDVTGAAKSYSKMGEVYLSLGLYEDGLTCYNNSLEIYKALEDKNFQGEALINKGVIYIYLGSYENSLKSCREALSLYEDTGNKKGQGDAFEYMGDVYNTLKLPDEALKYHIKSMTCFLEAGVTDRIAVNLCKIGEDYFLLGDSDYGLEKLQEALDIAKVDNSVSYEILIRTGKICRNNGYYDKSLKMYREARKISKKLGNKDNEIKALLEIAKTHVLRGTDDEAFLIYEKIMEVADEAGNKGRKFDSLFYMGDIYDNPKHGRYESALDAYNKCLAFYESVDNRWGMIQVNQKLGENYERMGDIEKATHYYIKSIDLLEDIRGEMKLDEFKQSFSEMTDPVYKKVINFFIETGKTKEAFNYLEMARARALLDALNNANVDIKEGADPRLLEKDKKLQAEINYTQTSLVQEESMANPDKERIKELESKLAGALKELETVQQELVLTSPSYAFLTGIKKPLTMDEIQSKVLNENEFVLEYFVNKDVINAWIISKNSYEMVEIPLSETELAAKVETMRKPFEEVEGSSSRFTEVLSKFDVQNLKDLYDLLFKPVVSRLPLPQNANLIIVPDGILYYIPFEILVKETGNNIANSGITFSEFSDNKYLIEDYSISYSPSACSLDPDLAAGNKKKISGLFLGFGDPYFGGPSVLSEDSPETVVEEKTEVSDEKDMFITGFINLQGSEGGYLAPLPNTGIQVQNIENLFKDSGQTEIYLQKDATEERVKRKCSDFKYLLFATHGLLKEETPMLSSVVFSLGPDPAEDGFLTAAEILNLDINADLVVLSACETGLGEIKTGEGVIGLTRAFMYAGAPSIVVSLWSVESGSTARLMEVFYENLLSGMTKSEALRQAKIKFIKGQEVMNGENISFSHPFFWAPFILVGRNN